MKIEKISPECSEISIEDHTGVTNLMNFCGGMLYALADNSHGTAASRWKEYVTPERTCEFYPERIGGTVMQKESGRSRQ